MKVLLEQGLDEKLSQIFDWMNYLIQFIKITKINLEGKKKNADFVKKEYTSLCINLNTGQLKKLKNQKGSFYIN